MLEMIIASVNLLSFKHAIWCFTMVPVKLQILFKLNKTKVNIFYNIKA